MYENTGFHNTRGQKHLYSVSEKDALPKMAFSACGARREVNDGFLSYCCDQFLRQGK